MSDPTKKSIVINKSFLSGSDTSGTSSTIQNKKSRKNARILSEEIIRPNKLKKILLDKINAKRKAEHSSYNNGGISGNNPITSASISTSSKDDRLDISKESRLFSNEFKKSLDFLDSYIGQRVSNNKNKNKNKTLKSQPTLGSQTSLHTDIIKSVHNNNQNLHVLHPSNNVHQSIQTPPYMHQVIHPQPQMYPSSLQHTQQAPLFQKIQLNIPSSPIQSMPTKILPNTLPKINLAIKNTDNLGNQPIVYTELPPELQNYTPAYTPSYVPSYTPQPIYELSSPSVSPSVSASDLSFDTLPSLEPYTNIGIDMYRDDTDARETDKLESINTNSETSLFSSSTTFSPVKLSDDSPYGCLKDGKKPTFRTYNKTIKNNAVLFNKEKDTDTDTDAVYSERQSKLRELRDKHTNNKYNNAPSSKNSNDSDNRNDEIETSEKGKHNLRKTKLRRRLRKTVTKTFKLGKQSGNIVGVLIKNNDTRKNVQKEHGLLKSKHLADIKKILVEKNLIKIGSTAPPGIIRNIYESSMLTGDVENVGKGIGLHNFLEDKKPW